MCIFHINAALMLSYTISLEDEAGKLQHTPESPWCLWWSHWGEERSPLKQKKKFTTSAFQFQLFCLNSNLQWEDCKVVKYFQNNLSGLYASLTLEHGEKGWDTSEEEGCRWGGGIGGLL